MARLRRWIATVAVALGMASQLHAQTRHGSSLLCWHALPAAGCRAFVLTNFGVYAGVTGPHVGQALASGMMVNVTRTTR